MRKLANRIVHARTFEYLLIALIIGAGILLGIDTSADVLDWYVVLVGVFALLTLLAVLVLEVFLKMFALFPRVDRYFRNGWNVFDFLVIRQC